MGGSIHIGAWASKYHLHVIQMFVRLLILQCCYIDDVLKMKYSAKHGVNEPSDMGG